MGWRFPEIGHPHSAEAGVLLVFPIQYWKNQAATLADLINRGLPTLHLHCALANLRL